MEPNASEATVPRQTNAVRRKQVSKLIAVHFWIMLLATATFADEPQAVPISRLEKDFELVGKLHVPLGKVIEIEGIAVEGPFKGFEGGPNLRVQRIGGNYHQQDIQIVIKPFFYDWGKEATVGGEALPKLEFGKTYHMQGFETGGYVGVPGEAFRRGAVVVQTTGHYFQTRFVVIKAKPIEPIVFSPSMFEGQRALLTGVARTTEGHSVMQGPDWAVIVSRGKSWPEDIEGKHIETFGMYNPDSSRKDGPKVAEQYFDLIDGRWSLVHLKDQIGRKVVLRGTARSQNGVWWFNYRGIDLYVEDMEQLPGWTSDNHWRPMVIEGKLDQATLPRLDQVTLKRDRDRAEYFIVREASWKPLGTLLSPESPPPTEQ